MRKHNAAETKASGHDAQHSQFKYRVGLCAHHLVNTMDVSNQGTFSAAAKNQPNFKCNNRSLARNTR